MPNDVTTEQATGGVAPQGVHAGPGTVQHDAAYVQPPAPAPALGQPEVQPEPAPTPSPDELDYGVDITKLDPVLQKTAKQFQSAYTKARQKDAEAVRKYEDQMQSLRWAADLNALAGSEDPKDRARAAMLLKSAASMLDQSTPQAVPSPLEGVDWDSVESIAPGLGKAIQALVAQNQTLQQQIGNVATSSEAAAERLATQQFESEAVEVQEWATKQGLPFDLDRIVAAENELQITDLRTAYLHAYRDELPDLMRKSAQANLQARKQAALPGGGPIAGKTEARPKMTSMLDHWEYAKRQAGISGPIEYKG